MNNTISKVARFIVLLLGFTACSSPHIKIAPEYHGVDERARSLVNEYFWLSKQNNITFTHKVSVGFKVLNDGLAVGMCTFGPGWREIDIDSNYWYNSTNTTRLALVFHELTHCYCGRDHDYEEGKKYPETEAARVARALKWLIEGGERPGYWDDGCPISFMHPSVVDDECTMAHYNEYLTEMFTRCQPY